jgi:hypothetical protein
MKPEYDWVVVRKEDKTRFKKLAKDAGVIGLDYFASLLPSEEK